MRLIKFIKPCLIIITLLVVMTSCKKDEVSNTGDVKVSYTNAPSDLYVKISPAENPEIVISDRLIRDNNGALTCKLNIGNYILNSYSSTFYPPVGFQVRPGETTVITFDASNSGHVQ
jgi:hypothetical protein